MAKHVYDRLGELTVLQGFLEAKLWMALREYDKWLDLYGSGADEYVQAKYRYAINQISVIRQLLRDAANPERTLKRWLKHLEKSAEQSAETDGALSAPK
jgi:hypothetical protein